MDGHFSSQSLWFQSVTTCAQVLGENIMAARSFSSEIIENRRGVQFGFLGSMIVSWYLITNMFKVSIF